MPHRCGHVPSIVQRAGNDCSHQPCTHLAACRVICSKQIILGHARVSGPSSVLVQHLLHHQAQAKRFVECNVQATRVTINCQYTCCLSCDVQQTSCVRLFCTIPVLSYLVLLCFSISFDKKLMRSCCRCSLLRQGHLFVKLRLGFKLIKT